ncbi:MAG: flagellar hook-associated protein FlgK, partial [Pseudomonadales bacterium]|nr:flagellar hook-associated protein FlgK [Pseudomonadales bacterium]
MADLLNIALSGLRAFRSSLNTAGHNIANVNTPGYSRQRVDLAAQQPMYMGGSFLGSGVATVEVSRVYDQFLTGRVRELTATQAQEAALHGLASQIDGMLGDSAAGIAPALADFFSALQDLAADPAAIPARQVVLGNAAALADRFGSLGAQLESLAGIADNQLGSAVDSANHLATQIADLNREILISQGTSGDANDLLDRRDEIVRQLAQYAKVSVSEPGDGTLSVFLGNGQPLVVGTSVQQLSLVRDRFDPQRWQIG